MHGEAPVVRKPKPGAAVLQVATGQDVGMTVPPGKRGGRASEELVAIGGDGERIAPVDLPADDDEAHGYFFNLGGSNRRPLYM